MKLLLKLLIGKVQVHHHQVTKFTKFTKGAPRKAMCSFGFLGESSCSWCPQGDFLRGILVVKLFHTIQKH